MLIAALIALGGGSQAEGEDWHRYRGPRQDGISSESDWRKTWPVDGPPIAWKANVGTGFSSVVVSDGRLYTMGNTENTDTVYCLSIETGKPLWTHSYPSPMDPNEFEGGPTSTPTVDGDAVFTLGRRGELFCFDKNTGTVRWSINVAEQADVRVPAWGFSGSPLVYQNSLILNVGEAGAAVDKRSGKILWSSGDKDAGYASPVELQWHGKPAVLIASGRSVVCMDAETGTECWKERWLTTFGCNAADPIVSGTRVFLSSGYNRGSALLDTEPEDPAVLWKHKDFQNQLCTSVLLDGHLYGLHGDVANGASLKCVHFDSGEVKWSDDQIRAGAIAAADGHLIVLSDSGELCIAPASPTGFTVTSRHAVLDGKCWTVPVLAGGCIYCRSADGTLVCVDLRNR